MSSFKEAVASVDWLGSDRMTRIENRKYYIRVDSYNLHQVIIATRTLYWYSFSPMTGVQAG